jgi:hypothetical protein
MDAEILGHCDGYSGESDLVIQSCLHAAKDAASMEECIVGDNESDDLDSPPG